VNVRDENSGIPDPVQWILMEIESIPDQNSKQQPTTNNDALSVLQHA
jgi:hypothetical protein